MKKTIIILLLLAGFCVQAQYDTIPHNVGLPNYFMNHSLDSLSIIQHDNVGCRPKLDNIAYTWSDEYGLMGSPWTDPAHSDSGDFAFGFYPDSTINVIGVAWTVWLLNVPYGDSSNWFWDSVVVKLFHPSGDSMNILSRKTIIRDTFSYSKVMDYCRGWSEEDSAILWGVAVRSIPDPIYEVFFDKEHAISDSLYLSVKIWNDGQYSNIDMTQGFVERHSRGGLIPFVYPIQSYRMKDTPGDDDPWTYGEQHSYPLLFPIIRLEGDTCPEVRNVRFTRAGANAAIARWDQGTNHRDWQFYIGPQGLLPNEDETVTETLPRHMLDGLSPTAHYDVYVRARCVFSRDTWSPWTGPIDLCLSPEGVDGADAVEWSMNPNPAQSSVTVQCSLGIMDVELLSMKGETLMHKDVAGEHSCTLDLTGLAKGIYIVQVRSPQGTTARKLAVE